MTKTILIDMDDTIENFIPAWVAYLNNKYGTTVDPDEITDWDITLFFPSITKEQVFEPIYNDSFWATVKPKSDAITYIKKLIEDGHKIYICTASGYQTLRAKMDSVLFKYFDYLTWDNVIVTSHKHLIQADYLIDDRPKNLIDGAFKGILFDIHHNRDFDNEKYGITRVKNWEEIYSLIK